MQKKHVPPRLLFCNCDYSSPSHFLPLLVLSQISIPIPITELIRKINDSPFIVNSLQCGYRHKHVEDPSANLIKSA